MQNYYNMNQMTLSVQLDYEPQENHPARYINALVEQLELDNSYVFGRPREYDLSAMLKLVLFAYTRGIFSSRQIQLFAEENKPAGWLTSGQVPSYRTICRFRISEELFSLIDQGLINLTVFLKKQGLIDEVSFIDGTKIVADANKYSFVWKKKTIQYDQMNREQLVSLLGELHEAKLIDKVPDGSDITPESLNVVISMLEDRLTLLNERIEDNPKLSPNPDKQERRSLKSKKRKISERRDKMIEHQIQSETFGERNSFSKTDTDATFMRVKEDPMQNGQLKPAYNWQLATSNQFITGYQLFQNPTDTRTLIPFIEHLNIRGTLGQTIVADAGYGSERNYTYCEDKLDNQRLIAPYGTMLKENSRKWKSDDKKVMNWDYHEQDDYYLDPKNIRFDFIRYTTRTDKYGFQRYFKVYQAEKYTTDQQVIPESLTPKGNIRTIMVNPTWEYHKAKQRELLSAPETGQIYGQRKTDVEPVFGKMKASLHFNRFSVRGLEKVKKEAGIVVMALNILKLVSMVRNKDKTKNMGKNQKRFLSIFHFLETTYVTASFSCYLLIYDSTSF
ncbi:IS1182 family transposase [Companilactobacillus hulinensis]|uniref:IS1182 family transposase n=1 Tax=Companilactobacillus hulinensis TaxID=2486007 RepID=UPI000F77B0CE|nr:IS1182 family transposase [Companilactobacillus hulinensis]